MYKIIGADGRQYGPANIDQLRTWLAENRLRTDTLVQAEGTMEWKPLNSIPEFASPFQSIPPISSAPPAVRPQVCNPRASNKIPAGICGILLGGLGVHKFILGYTGAGIIMLLLSVLTCGIAYGIMHVIGIVEGIVYLTKSDDEFVRTYVDGRKEWF